MKGGKRQHYENGRENKKKVTHRMTGKPRDSKGYTKRKTPSKSKNFHKRNGDKLN